MNQEWLDKSYKLHDKTISKRSEKFSHMIILKRKFHQKWRKFRIRSFSTDTAGWRVLFLRKTHLEDVWRSSSLILVATKKSLRHQDTTVVTPNKGQSIFGKIGSNKGISLIPLFVILDKWWEIRNFSVEISQKW